jgi:hypothetical protein
MVLINEAIRTSTKEQLFTHNGITAINSAASVPGKCTWKCHNATDYCKAHHVQFLKPVLSKTDVIYHGVINRLRDTGNYDMANIVFLVLLFPLAMYFFIIKSLNIQDEIRKLKQD